MVSGLAICAHCPESIQVGNSYVGPKQGCLNHNKETIHISTQPEYLVQDGFKWFLSFTIVCTPKLMCLVAVLGEEQTAPCVPYIAEVPVVAGTVPPSELLFDAEGPKICQAMFCETIPLPLTSEADFLHTNWAGTGSSLKGKQKEVQLYTSAAWSRDVSWG